MRTNLTLLNRRLRVSTFVFLGTCFLFLLSYGQKSEEPEVTVYDKKEDHHHEKGEVPFEHKEAGQEGETHAHKSPHGGVVRTVQNFHVEYVVRHEGVDVYLYDNKENPLSIEGMWGFISLQFPGGGMKRVDLKPILKPDKTSPNHLHAPIDLEKEESFKGRLSLNSGKAGKKGVRISFRFEDKGEHDHKKRGKKNHHHEEGEAHVEHKETGQEGEAHAHKSPHGGVTRTVRDFHVEYVVRHEGMDVYLYDTKENPLSIEGMEGFISLQLPEGEMKKVDLKPILEADKTSPNHLHAAIDLEEVESFKGLLSLNVGQERIITLRFETKGDHAGHEEHK